jgi:predicted short-subunit dehydrogenase-like oxidoreductase (DUF2520 family)
MLKTAVIIGSGNLATQLAIALHNSGLLIKQVYSRSIENANLLAKKINADATNDYLQIYSGADIYFLALSDDVQQEFADVFPFKDKLIVHTSGSLPMDILKNASEYFAVFYPLQTFNKEVELEFSKIPVCIEANSKEILNKLKYIAEVLSCKWHIINSEKRKILHVSAVFACNFSNHMVSIAENILENNNIPKEITTSLLEQTFHKILEKGAKNSQTGPALRNDTKIMEKHNKLLKKQYPEYSELYKTISNSIFEFYNKDYQHDSE